MVIIFPVIIIGVVIAVVMASGNKKNDKPVADSPYVEVEKEGSSIHFSDDFKSKEPILKIEKNHTIKTIYTSKEDKFMWVCSNCEVENPASKTRCCVCNCTK